MIQSGLGETPQDVLQDSSVLEVLNLHISIESHLHIERLASVGGDFQGFMDLEVTFSDVDAEAFLATQT